MATMTGFAGVGARDSVVVVALFAALLAAAGDAQDGSRQEEREQQARVDACAAQLGEPFELVSCRRVALPRFEIERTGEGRRDPELPVWCVDHEIRSATDRIELPLCSTGLLGGTAEFTLDGVGYVVDRDVPVRCVEGSWRLGLTIWRDDPDLPELEERSPRVESFRCAEGAEGRPGS